MQDVVRLILDDFKLEGVVPLRDFDVAPVAASPSAAAPHPVISFSPQPSTHASEAELEWFNDLLSRAASFACQNTEQGLAGTNSGSNNA